MKRTYPVSPLIDVLCLLPGESATGAIHRLVGGDRRVIHRTIHTFAMLTEREADEWSVACDLHPAILWPGQWCREKSAVPTLWDERDERVCDGCWELIEPWSNAATCSAACRKRVSEWRRSAA